MTLRAEEAKGLLALHRRTIEQAQDAAYLLVEFLRGVLAFLNQSLIGQCHEIIVVGIRGTHRQSVGPRAKLQIESVLDGLFCVVASSPVGNDDAVIFPVAFQNLVQQYIIVAIVLVLIKIVGTHDTPCTSLGDCSLESWQIDLVERTIADHDIHLMTILLVVVQGIVLHTSCDALRLESLDIRHHHARCQPRILAHILEVAASERGAVDVHARPQDHTLSAIQGFLAQTLTVKTCHLGIPRSCQTRERRESHAGVVGLSCLLPLVPKHIGAHSVRSVIRPEIRESQALDARTAEFTLRMDDGNLLVECHATQGIVNALLYWFALIEIYGHVLCLN